jgi:intracellular multiplication protein IcmG
MSGDKDIDDELAVQEDIMDDGFDDVAPGEDEDFADEDWDSYDEEGEGDESDDQQPRKKDSSKFNKMVIGGAVMLGLCVLVFNIMTGKPPQQPGAPAAVQAAQGLDASGRKRLNSASLSDSAPTTQRDVVYGRNREDAQEAIKQSAVEVPEAGGLLNNPGEVKKIEDYRAKLEQDLIEQEQQAAAAEEQSTLVVPDQEQPLPAETPQAVTEDPPMPVPMAQSSDVLTPLPEAAAAPAAPVDVAPVADAVAVDRAAVDAIADAAPVAADAAAVAPAEDIPSVGLPRAQDLTLGDAPAAAAAPVVSDMAASETAAPASADVFALTAKVETLQGALDQQTARVKDLESTVQQLERALESRASAPSERAAPVKKRSSSASSSGGSAAKKSASTTTVRWVLKSAQPGRAMVSRAGEQEMRNVTVGDDLPGVGRVTQIYQGQTGWIVQGTTGRILQ